MPSPPLWKHIRDILLLPFTVTVVVPLFIYRPLQTFIPRHWSLQLAGLLLLIAGLCLFLVTVRLFVRRGQGTLASWQPTQKLVVTGPYRYCRNPMISGVGAILAGETLLLHSASIGWWTAAFFLVNTLYFMFSEEPGLQQRFGSSYLHYKRHVPRWLPRLTPYRPEDELQ